MDWTLDSEIGALGGIVIRRVKQSIIMPKINCIQVVMVIQIGIGLVKYSILKLRGAVCPIHTYIHTGMA
jgi:hypothetical protein